MLIKIGAHVLRRASKSPGETGTGLAKTPRRARALYYLNEKMRDGPEAFRGGVHRRREDANAGARPTREDSGKENASFPATSNPGIHA